MLLPDPVTGDVGGGNVVTMSDGWERIWSFLADQGLLTQERAAQLNTPQSLEEHTLLPHTRKIRQLAMTPQEVAEHRAAGTLADEVVDRAAQIGGLLALSDEPAKLKDSQRTVIAAVADGRNVLGLLPTGFGKSFCFQLPALVLPGVTIVVSPLVALMTDQALALNRSIGGAVRALVAPLRESSSRAGKTEVADQLLGRADHGIRMVYVSPERLTQRRFREVVREAVKSGIVTRIALDEAHTFVQWDDFRPSMGRVEMFLEELRRDHGLPLTALTATANRTVLAGLRDGVFGLPGDTSPDIEAAEAAAGTLLTVRENPIRPELALFRRSITAAGPATTGGLAEEVASAVTDHAIFYCLTVKEVIALARAPARVPRRWQHPGASLPRPAHRGREVRRPDRVPRSAQTRSRKDSPRSSWSPRPRSGSGSTDPTCEPCTAHPRLPTWPRCTSRSGGPGVTPPARTRPPPGPTSQRTWGWRC